MIARFQEALPPLYADGIALYAMFIPILVMGTEVKELVQHHTEIGCGTSTPKPKLPKSPLDTDLKFLPLFSLYTTDNLTSSQGKVNKTRLRPNGLAGRNHRDSWDEFSTFDKAGNYASERSGFLTKVTELISGKVRLKLRPWTVSREFSLYSTDSPTWCSQNTRCQKVFGRFSPAGRKQGN